MAHVCMSYGHTDRYVMARELMSHDTHTSHGTHTNESRNTYE